MSETIIITSSISKSEIIKMAEERFGDMVKGVVDIGTGEVALGGELHSDQESLLLENGNKQENLWGFNVYVEEEFPDSIEFDSMINIRPTQNNRSRDVEDPAVRKKMLAILEKVLP